ncbi:hypothetical protein BH23CHL8_BH23CHL8_00900 [soil metagenome]
MATQERTIVSGSATTVAGLGKGEGWLKDWLAEAPTRLGIGQVTILDDEPVQDEDGNPAFLASDDERYFSVNVQLGELDASQGFHVLDSWARNRVRHPDKTHVAVLVTEQASGRYHTALEALAEHLPLVVVELQAWRGRTEVIIAPRIALASKDLELSTAPHDAAEEPSEAAASTAPVANASGAPLKAASGSAPAGEQGKPGVPEVTLDDPWKLPKRDTEPVAAGTNGA